MATLQCPVCNSNLFEMIEDFSTASSEKVFFVKCGKCGRVVDEVNSYNIGTEINELREKVEALKDKGGFLTVNKNLEVINQNISKLFNILKNKL